MTKPRESCAREVPGCLAAAVEHLLYGVQLDELHPTQANMIAALQCTFELDGEGRYCYATSPSGQVYEFDMEQAEGRITVAPNDQAAWIIWLVLMALAGLEQEMQGRSDRERFRRSISDGTTTVHVHVKSMYFQQT